MNFDYFSIGQSTSVQMPIREKDLAAYIGTEWIPRTPPSIISGLADLLGGMLRTETIDGSRCWCINPELAFIDRQWSGATSWLIGVAFARHIIEQEGFPFWVPVSAFRGDRSTGKTITGHWLSLPKTAFEVRKTDSSNLLPDYVMGRIVDGRFEYGFAESKGTDKSIGRHIAPSSASWINQVRDVDLYFKKNRVNISRRIIVATRVNPSAKSIGKRKITVRAWNSNHSLHSTSEQPFAHFLAIHYAGICWRLGHVDIAELMLAAALGIENNDRRVQMERYIQARQILEAHSVTVEPSEIGLRSYFGQFALAGQQNDFLIGNRQYRLALLPQAVNIMQRLVDGDLSRLPAILSSSAEQLRRLTGLTEERQTGDIEAKVLMNGVAVYTNNG